MRIFSRFLALAALLSIPVIAAASPTKSLDLDTEYSKVKWEGKKVAGAHNGTLSVKNGTVQFDDAGNVVGGKFELDMDSITNLDLDSPKYKTKLETHLKSDDFFNVSQFPLATFEIEKVKAGEKPDTYTVEGKLTVKGITKQVSFPAEIKKEGSVYQANAKFKIDRLKWDIKYNSGKFFDIAKLGDKLIYDDIEIELVLKTTEG